MADEPDVSDLPSGDDYDEFGAPFASLTDVKQARALTAFARYGKVTDACKAARVSRSAWYDWLERDPAFRRLYERILEWSTDELEEEGLSRAKESSDSLLMFFLRARRPALYREKQTIEVVSHDVQSRLAQQADAILAVCKDVLPADQAAIVASRIAHRLRDIWATEDDRKRVVAASA